MDPASRATIRQSSVLETLGRRLTQSRAAVYAACKATKACPVEQMMLNQLEIETTGDELSALARAGASLNKLVHDEMRPCPVSPSDTNPSRREKMPPPFDGASTDTFSEFADRCARELGYQPVDILDRLSPFDLAARPNLISLHADPQDPLDP
jgi:hypothetical protein